MTPISTAPRDRRILGHFESPPSPVVMVWGSWPMGHADGWLEVENGVVTGPMFGDPVGWDELPPDYRVRVHRDSATIVDTWRAK